MLRAVLVVLGAIAIQGHQCNTDATIVYQGEARSRLKAKCLVGFRNQGYSRFRSAANAETRSGYRSYAVAVTGHGLS